LHILINDFIGGVLDRGIPLYVRNLVGGLREEGFEVSVIRAPSICRVLPRNLFYMIAVLVEQFALPIAGYLLRADLTLYPYNSVAIADLFTRRARIVVHDLEQLNRGMSLSKIYYLACYRFLKKYDSPIFTISELTRQRIGESELFGRCPVVMLPNTFYTFERYLRALKRKPGLTESPKSLLLCTGSTANKDIETLVTGYLPKVLAAGFQVSILGLHKASDAPRLSALQSFIDSGQLHICGRLSDRAVAREYRSHGIVWVHSLREGFGRCLVEGRLAGAHVICSDIPEFEGLRDDAVHFYKDADQFTVTLDRLVHMPAPISPYNGYPYRELLRSGIERGFREIAAGRTAPQIRPAG
jgi:glycosyltransferase involved in cell wall biosynthesis